MSDSDLNEPQTGAFALQADLSPADASAVREGLLAALNAATEAKQPLAIEVEGEGGTPCALQLLVAAKRSADSAKVELNLSEKAGAMLASVRAD